MKHMTGIRTVTASLILAGAAAVFASGCSQQEKRETAKAEAQQPAAVSQAAGSGEAQDALLEAIFDRVSSDEYVLVETGAGGAVERGIFRTFDTAAELKDALEADDSPLRLFDAPDGYELISARAWYDCAEGYEYEPVAEETDDSGLRIKRYTVTEEGRFISWCELEYAAPDGKAFRMAGYLMSEMDTAAMEGEIMESVAVDGMDEALLFRGTDGSSARLEMRQSLAEPFVCVSSTSVAEMPPGFKDSPAYEETTHITIDHARYSLRADGMDGDMLLALVTAG